MLVALESMCRSCSTHEEGDYMGDMQGGDPRNNIDPVWKHDSASKTYSMRPNQQIYHHVTYASKTNKVLSRQK